jgi:methionyl-tRNA formyltransferase
MRVVFFGTPEVAVPSLRALLDSRHSVAAVVTQPDKPKGRGRALTASPVKELALASGLPVMQPRSPKDDAFVAELRSHAPEALAIVAYGHILSPSVLDVAPALNVHFSLLPAYRGAAPVQRALMQGERETGVSVFLLEPTVDTGPVLVTERTPIGDEETAGELLSRLSPIGARALVQALDGLEMGTAAPVEQDDTKASKAPKISPEETKIDWSRSAHQIVNTIRALSPKPGAWTPFRGKRLGVLRARVVEGAGTPGTVILAEPLVIAGGDGAVELLEVQPEGKRPMEGAGFVRGYRPDPGEGLSGNGR